MKLVKESLNEFERGRDPIEAMDIGLSPEEKLKIKQKVPVLKRKSPYLGKNKHDNKVYSRGYSLWKLLDYIAKGEDGDGVGRRYKELVKFYYNSDFQRTISSGLFNSLSRYTKGWIPSNDPLRRGRLHKVTKYYFLNKAGWEYWQKYKPVFSMKESVNFERGQDPMRAMHIGNPIIHIEMVTVANNIKNGKIVRDDYTEYLLDAIKEKGAKYKVISEKGGGGGWPIIEFIGTKEQLIPILCLFDSYGRERKEIEKALENWYGDEDELTEILF